MGFGTTPEQIAEIVAKWRHCGTEIGDLKFEATTVSLAGTRTASAVQHAGTAARTCSTSLSRQLLALGDALQAFNARTVESDQAAASALAAVRRLS